MKRTRWSLCCEVALLLFFASVELSFAAKVRNRKYEVGAWTHAVWPSLKLPFPEVNVMTLLLEQVDVDLVVCALPINSSS